jgi:hypothetical protein
MFWMFFGLSINVGMHQMIIEKIQPTFNLLNEDV